MNSVVVVLKTLSLIVGSLVTYYAVKAAQRTGHRSLQFLGVGFGLITIGALLAGITDQLLSFDRTTALAIESAFTTVGFLIVLYSLVMDVKTSVVPK